MGEQAVDGRRIAGRTRVILCAGTALAAIAALGPSPATASDLDLAGSDVTLPSVGHFGDQPYLNGTDNLTNGGLTDATLTEGGGAAGTVYSGFISDGAFAATAIGHTSGEVTFTSANSYSGGTTLSGGTLIVQDNDALGTGTLTFNGGILQAGGFHGLANDIVLAAPATIDANGFALALDGDISGSAPLLLTSAGGFGSFVFQGNNTNSGPTTVDASAILAAGSTTAFSADSDFVVDGSLVLDGFDNTIRSLSGGGSVSNDSIAAATLTIALPFGSATYSGNLDDGGLAPLSLVKSGAGTQILDGTSTYSGSTTILAGTLVGANDFALSGFSAVKVNSGAALIVGNGVFADIASLADGPGGGGNVVIGPGDPLSALFITAAPFIAISFSGAITGEGSLTLEGGALTLTGASNIGGDLVVCDCAELTVSGPSASLNATGTGIIALSGLPGAEISGKLNVLAGASFSTDNLLIGDRMVADGRGTAVTANGLTFVGFETTAANLTIGGGAHVSSLGGVVIENPFQPATAVVTGRDTVWNIGQGLLVGNFFVSAHGGLSIAAGAVANVSGGTAIAADLAFGLGPSTVAVTGAQSALNTDTLAIGATCFCGDLPGVLTVADGGTVKATGAVTIANVGTLELGTGGKAGLIVAPNIDNSGKIVADFTDTATLAANISGAGTLTKDGAGRLILSGNNSYTGATTVNGGVLSVNGSNAGSAVTVNAGGILGGSGVVGATSVNDRGAIGPGNSVGTLTVRNSLTFAPGSTYAVEVDAGGADRIDVKAGAKGPGNASLAGGSVAVDFLSTGNLKSRYTILGAAGGLGGTKFAGVSDDQPGIATSLSYAPGTVYLDAALTLNRLPGLTVNQKDVAETLVASFEANGTLPLAFATLDAAGLTIASGEVGTGAIQSGFEASDRFLDVISDRFIQSDGGGVATPPAGYAEESAGSTAQVYGALLEKRSAHAMAAAGAGQWKGWGSVYGASATVDGDSAVIGSHDLDTSLFGVAAGAGWSEGDVGFGAALGGGHSNFDLDDGLGSGDAGIFNAGLYGRAAFGQAYVLGAVAYGYHDVSTSRAAFGEILEASYGAHSFSGRAEAGYRVDTGWAGLTPYAAFQGTALHIPSYSETAGTFALDFDSDTASQARGELGLRLDRTIALDEAALRLSGRATWAHGSDDDHGLVASFQTLPGTSFTVYGADPDSDSALVDLAAAMSWRNGWSASLAFQGQFSGNYSSYSGGAKLSFSW